MVITKHLPIIEGKKGEIPYAGYYVIVQPNGVLSLDKAKEILESDNFYEFVKSHGTPTSVDSYRISAAKIMDNKFPKSLL